MIFYNIPVSAQETSCTSPTINSKKDDIIIYSGDIIVWKYKYVNGKLYKENIIKPHKNGSEVGFPLKIFFFFSLNKYIYIYILWMYILESIK